MRFGGSDDPFDGDDMSDREQYFHADDDARVLAALKAHGVDLSRPRDITFFCFAPSRLVAVAIAQVLAENAYATQVLEDEEEAPSSPHRLSVAATIMMAPTLEGVKDRSEEICMLIERFGVGCDGWETAVERVMH
ncbi:MAG: ribonuclease E inhibitor RraB [Pseudomonadota bacterium]